LKSVIAQWRKSKLVEERKMKKGVINMFKVNMGLKGGKTISGYR